MKGHVFTKHINTDNFYYSSPRKMSGPEFTEYAQDKWNSLVVMPNEGVLKFEVCEGGFLIFGNAFGFVEKTKDELLNEIYKFKDEKKEECSCCKLEPYERRG